MLLGGPAGGGKTNPKPSRPRWPVAAHGKKATTRSPSLLLPRHHPHTKSYLVAALGRFITHRAHPREVFRHLLILNHGQDLVVSPIHYQEGVPDLLLRRL